MIGGVFVTGKFAKANRRVIFQPDHAGMHPASQVWYDGGEERIKTDDRGEWRVQLAPSSVVGCYTLKALGQTMRIWVPDNVKSATLPDVLRLAEENDA